MNDVHYINAVAQSSAQRIAQYETYIGSSMYAAGDMDALESMFDSKIDDLRNDVHVHTETIGNVVKSKFPSPWDPDYYNKRQYVNALGQYACAQINYLEGTFDNTFSRLNNLFHRLSAWIRNKAKQVYGAVKGFFRSAISKVKGWFS